jgi:cob(I)alamin adenosyltransferase
MIPRKKYKLSRLLKEIDDDIHEFKTDLSQEKNISQDIITELMLANLKKQKQTARADKGST